MNCCVSRVALVLLRLAVGWHFLFEGLEKVHSVYVGPTTTNKVWTAEGYFRESTGPIGPLLRKQIGDLDEQTLGALVTLPGAETGKPGAEFAHKRMPPGLAKEWDAYAAALAAHYRLTPEQRETLDKRLTQLKDSYVAWIEDPKNLREIKRVFPSGTVETKQSLRDRIQEYQAKVAEAKQTLETKLYAFGADVEGPKLRALKAEVAALRTELSADVEKQTTQAKEALRAAVEMTLNESQQGLPKYEEPTPSKPIEWINWATRWGLVVAGSCLLLGLFTRVACLGAAAFLATLYLASPPFPWLPSPPFLEGHYLFVNKNLIEMFALVALATLPTGRWFGLDYVLAKLFGRKCQKAECGG
jgi:uncharacterized membrane protein YphA (DoxX/SURF4 family)